MLTGMISHVVPIEQAIRKAARSLGLEVNEILVRDKAIAIGAIAKFPFCRQGKERRYIKTMKDKYDFLIDERNKLLMENDNYKKRIDDLLLQIATLKSTEERKKKHKKNRAQNSQRGYRITKKYCTKLYQRQGRRTRC